jgi:hypothetical protein
VVLGGSIHPKPPDKNSFNFHFSYNEEAFLLLQMSSVVVENSKYPIYDLIQMSPNDFAFVNKIQNQYEYTWYLTLIDKCKMCHFECHGLKLLGNFGTTCMYISNLSS